MLTGCPDQNTVNVVPNTPPQVTLEEPEPNEDGEPLVVDPGDSLRFLALVSDAEDPPEDLVLQWIAERTDTVAAPVDLGDTEPDQTGQSERWLGGLEPGTWSIEVTVVDTAGAEDTVAMIVQFLGENLAPGCAITSPQIDDEFIAGDLVTFQGTVNDDRPNELLDVEWFSNVDGLLDVAAPTAAGLLTFSRSNLTPGSHEVTLTATDEGGESCLAAVAFEIRPDDLPPTDPILHILPADPFTADDLTCIIFQGSADPEGEPISYAFQWFRDSAPTLNISDTVEAAETAALDEWTCQVMASDGTLNSNAVTASVVIQNSPPEVQGAVLSPSPAFENSVLTCAGVLFDDADGDPEDYVIQWTVAGVPIPHTGLTLDGVWFDRDEPVFCELTPTDGIDTGPSVVSDTITISNSPPTPPVVEVDPAPAATQDQGLACLIDSEAADLDGDSILNPDSYEVTWLVDGVPDAASDGLWIVPAVRTELGQEWTCQVRATDGTDWSDYAEASTTVLPLSGDLVISEFLANPDGVADVAGEWIELYNASGLELDLEGFELSDDGADLHVISDSIVMPPGARVVLARNIDFVTNGGVLAAYEYSNFALGNADDSIVLSFGGEEIDRVDYDMTLYSGGLAGHALGFDEPSLGIPDPASNDDANNWCLAGNPIAGPFTDFGTPGGANDGCACFASDGDGDGYGDDPTCIFADCDDGNAAYHPEGVDVCENGIDENCDTLDAICPCLDTDNDGDGFGDGLACVPSDCNDANASVYPGAPETCNTVDEDCTGTADDGDPAVMCPPTTNATVTYCSTGDCYISACVASFYDVDGAYGTGCECQDDGANSACGVSTDLGSLSPGDAITASGRLPVNSLSDWVRVSFPASLGRPGAGTPTVSFSAAPDSSYRFDVHYDCASGPAGCGNGGVAANRTSWSFADAGSPAFSSNGTEWPEDIYIRVYRTSGGGQCTNWELAISR